MKPKIGITCGVKQNGKDDYTFLNYKNINVIKEAGGIPIILPSLKEECDSYLDIIDGIYFSGGNDVNPMFFGEDPVNGIGGTNILRDEFEIEIYKKAVEKDIPILGVCRGMQVINIAAGGTIYQDLKTQFKTSICHRQTGTPGYDYFHKVKIEKDSKLNSIYKSNEIYTNTFHHQAVKDIAPGFKASAKTKDGIIEAIESTNNKYVLAVQWHPEMMYCIHKEHFEVFKDFIKQCKRH